MRDQVPMVGGINMQGRQNGQPVDTYGLKGPFKGHMALKSSALAPTTTRLTGQYLLQDQMTSHYRRITSAKAVVDTTPPKSMAISTKLRDQHKRKHLERVSRMSSRASSRASSRDYTPPRTGRIRDELNEDRLTDYDYDLVNEIIDDTKNSPSAYRTPRVTTSRSYIPPDWQQRTMKAHQDDYQVQTKKWDQMDLLDTSKHKFKEPAKPHTPRTLKREAQSKIAQSKNYNPPRRKSANKDQDLLTTKDSYPEYNGEQERTASTNMVLNTTMRFSDIEKTKRGLVPTLKIKRDEDHAKWVQDRNTSSQMQTMKLDSDDDVVRRERDHDKWVEDQARRVAAMKLNETGVSEYMTDSVFESTLRDQSPDRFNSTRPFTTMHSDADDYGQMKTEPRPYSSHRFTRRLNSMRLKEEEDELKYLEFVTDVTTDVLNRGIYSNRVLTQIFDKHVERKRGQLEERRMRKLMDQLRLDLGIPEYD
ncbi:spermatogenesis-associated protein 7 homolog [Glandiceps talaboti]